ncbi:homeodomain-interacting protein kinase 1-like [Paralichthys olivaceus]|uniref:homeodomain-interacting protein kinase 1-like n=1 Tax=Paralichthys olivaceus TaxID=8255 RepID=UPI00375340A8
MSAMLPAKDNQLVPMSLLTSESSKYQVQSLLQNGTFGKVVKCMRLEDKKTVAIKMVKVQGSTANMAYNEVATLKKLKSVDPNKCSIVQWNNYFVDRGHLCLEFEYLDKSLMVYMKEHNFRPLLLKEIRPIVQQIAHALKHLMAAGIVHADLKLDNVMLVDQLREPFRVKVIDFGLSREASDAKLKTYIQTRPYRSPEILLGHPFNEAIDMWSLGCMAAAMYLGTLLYPGLGDYDMIKYIIDTQGQLPEAMLNRGHKTPKFFKLEVSFSYSFWKLKTPELYCKETGKQPIENRSLKFTSLDHIVNVRPINICNPANRAAEISDVHMFVDMLKAMLKLDPKTRITPHQLLEHNFISMRHIASMDQQSNYVRSSFQTMELFQKNILTSDSSVWATDASPAHCYKPLLAESSISFRGEKNDQPHAAHRPTFLHHHPVQRK